MNRPNQRVLLTATLAMLMLSACGASFRTNVADFRGATHPAFYQNEALDLQVHGDEGKVLTCRIRNAFSGRVEWQGEADVTEGLPGSVETLLFEPALPADGQLGLRAGTYEWVCDLDERTRATTLFDIRNN